jgi:hypothetical protein
MAAPSAACVWSQAEAPPAPSVPARAVRCAARATVEARPLRAGSRHGRARCFGASHLAHCRHRGDGPAHGSHALCLPSRVCTALRERARSESHWPHCNDRALRVTLQHAGHARCTVCAAAQVMTGSEATMKAVRTTLDAAGRSSVAIRAELGCASPWIVVPGAWSDVELERAAAILAVAKKTCAGSNCLAAQVTQLRSHTSHPHLLSTRRTHPSHPHLFPPLSSTPPFHTSHAPLSCTPLMHTSHAHVACTRRMHPSHAPLSCAPLMYTSHALLSCTPLMHPSHSTALARRSCCCPLSGRTRKPSSRTSRRSSARVPMCLTTVSHAELSNSLGRDVLCTVLPHWSSVLEPRMCGQTRVRPSAWPRCAPPTAPTATHGAR